MYIIPWLKNKPKTFFSFCYNSFGLNEFAGNIPRGGGRLLSMMSAALAWQTPTGEGDPVGESLPVEGDIILSLCTGAIFPEYSWCSPDQDCNGPKEWDLDGK